MSLYYYIQYWLILSSFVFYKFLHYAKLSPKYESTVHDGKKLGIMNISSVSCDKEGLTDRIFCIVLYCIVYLHPIVHYIW
jgi:hypothetical protein